MGSSGQTTKTMNRGRGDVFSDLNKLNEMLSLRVQGAGPSVLGAKYGVDHSTIIYHCKRAGVQVPGVRGMIIVASGVAMGTVIPIVKERKTKVVVQGAVAVVQYDFDGEILNQGKNYAEYIAERKKREEDKLFKRTQGS